jgi:uncharacterized membrane protein SpoIIM required for sporulation/uncharacterized RDD family membrane protein YckC
VTGSPRVPPDPLDLRQRHGVETPEHVELQFELAGVGSRTAAAMLDLVILTLLGTLFWTLIAEMISSGTMAGTWAAALAFLISAFVLFIYYVLFEGLNAGRTPGKMALGIRVVMDTGRPITLGAAALRNLLRLVDFFFPLAPLAPGMIAILVSRSNKRLGDHAAGTVVVRDRPTQWALAPLPATAAVEDVEVGPPDLSDDEFKLLDRFLARLNDLLPEVRSRLMMELARRFESRVPPRGAATQEYLLALFAEEQRKRRSRFATRAGRTGVGRTTVTAERFVARKRDTWEAFRVLATRLERRGVSALPPEEIPAFAARYREIAADLARARTYGVDAHVVEYLERLVSAGHNALYRARGRGRPPLARYLLAEFPGAVVASWRYVLAAFLLFAVPAGVGYVMLRERPEFAEEIVAPVMVSRAQQAAEREARGEGYAQSPDEELPVIASAIIANNIMVCFWAFTGGLLAGVFTAWALVTNGLMLGTGFGVFANYHAAGYLGTFIAGHGVLELTAIFISGGAGFRLAGALIMPGDRSRRDALVVEGRIAVKMIGAVICMLALAGTIEGLLSASDAPAAFKFAASGLSAILLAFYCANGRAALRRDARPASGVRS